MTSDRGLRQIMTSLALVSLVVQACSFVSSIALARVLGAGAATDAYYLGLSIPVLTYGILLSALRVGAIPALADVVKSSGDQSLGRSAGDLVSGVLVVSIALALVLTAGAELALPLVAGGSRLDLTRVILLELTPYAVFGAVTGALGAILAVRGVFAVPVAVMSLESVLKTILTFTLGHAIGVQALVLGNLLGSGLAVAVLWRIVRRGGVSLRVSPHFNTAFVRRTTRISVPLIASTSVLQINPIVDRVMATEQGVGSITALELGLRLFIVPAGLLAGLLAGPITATWAARKAEGGWSALQASVTRAVNGAAAVIPPVVILGVVLRREIVSLLFQGGAYPEGALDKTTSVFGMILLALPAQVLIVLFATLFVIHNNTVFGLKVALANVVLNIGFNFIFRPLFGVAGIALSTTLTYTLLVVVFAVGARRRWGTFYTQDTRLVVIRVLASTSLMACAAILLLSALPAAGSRWSALLVIAVVGTAAILVYACVLVLGRDPLAIRGVTRLRNLVVRIAQ